VLPAACPGDFAAVGLLGFVFGSGDIGPGHSRRGGRLLQQAAGVVVQPQQAFDPLPQV
jgi:hypothetical protein